MIYGVSKDDIALFLSENRVRSLCAQPTELLASRFAACGRLDL